MVHFILFPFSDNQEIMGKNKRNKKKNKGAAKGIQYNIIAKPLFFPLEKECILQY